MNNKKSPSYIKEKTRLLKLCNTEYTKILQNEIIPKFKEYFKQYKTLFFFTAKNKTTSSIELLKDNNYYHTELPILFTFKQKVVTDQLILDIKTKVLDFFNQKYCVYLHGSNATIISTRINPNDAGHSFGIVVKHYLNVDHVINYKKVKINLLIDLANDN